MTITSTFDNQIPDPLVLHVNARFRPQKRELIMRLLLAFVLLMTGFYGPQIKDWTAKTISKMFYKITIKPVKTISESFYSAIAKLVIKPCYPYYGKQKSYHLTLGQFGSRRLVLSLM